MELNRTDRRYALSETLPFSNDIRTDVFCQFPQPSSWRVSPRSGLCSLSRTASSGSQKRSVSQDEPHCKAIKPNHPWRLGLWRRLQLLSVLWTRHLRTSNRIPHLIKILQFLQKVFLFKETLMLFPMWRARMKWSKVPWAPRNCERRGRPPQPKVKITAIGKWAWGGVLAWIWDWETKARPNDLEADSGIVGPKKEGERY